MILRLLLLALLIWVGWRLYRTVQARLKPPAAPPASPEQFEPMARCARCGTFLPARSLSKDGLCGRCAT